MPAEIASIDALNNSLKRTDLLDSMVKQYSDPTVTLNQFEESTGKVVLAGQAMQFATEIQGTGSFLMKNELEQLPEPGVWTPGTVSVPVTEAWTAIQITERQIEASASDTYAWARGQAKTMANAIDKFNRYQNINCIYPASNALARVNDATPIASNTILDFEGTTAANGTTGAKFLIPGMRFSNSTATTGTTPTGTSNIRILTVNKSTNVITYDGTAGDLADDDYLIWGSKDRTSMGRGMVGLLDIIDSTGTYLGINRATAGNEYWQSTEIANVGTSPLELEICTAIDTLWSDNGSDIDMILSNVGSQRRHFVQSVQDRRYMKAAESGRYKSGYEYLAFVSPRNKDIAWVLDRDMLAGVALLIDKSTFRMGYTPNGRAKWFEPDKSGGPWHWVEGYAAWTAYYRSYGNLFCTTPNKNAKLTGITAA